MHIAEVRIKAEREDDSHSEPINDLLSAWHVNGQILASEPPIALAEGTYRVFLMLPRPDALESCHASKYVTTAVEMMSKVGLAAPEVTVVGEDPFSVEPCDCARPGYFILYTDFASLESSLRCGECFGPLPLYVIPPRDTPDGELHDLIRSWQGDYQSCDRLQMGCRTGESFGLREMSQPDSSLSQRGRTVCKHITEATNVPTFYYLHRYRGRSLSSEKRRRCPVCGGEWLLPEQLHEKFDFKCDQCRLLSSIALSFPQREPLSVEQRQQIS